MKRAEILAGTALVLGAQASVAAGGPLAFGDAIAIAIGNASGNGNGAIGLSNTPTIGGFTDLYIVPPTEAGTLGGSISSSISGTVSGTLSSTLGDTLSESITPWASGLKEVDFIGILPTGSSGAFDVAPWIGESFQTWGLAATRMPMPMIMTARSDSPPMIGLHSPAAGPRATHRAATLVPEPSPYALLLAGVAVVVLLARRRRA